VLWVEDLNVKVTFWDAAASGKATTEIVKRMSRTSPHELNWPNNLNLPLFREKAIPFPLFEIFLFHLDNDSSIPIPKE